MATLISDKVNITAPTIQLTGSININNGTFTVDTSGNMTAKSGTFSGTLVSGDKFNYNATSGISGCQISESSFFNYGTHTVYVGNTPYKYYSVMSINNGAIDMTCHTYGFKAELDSGEFTLLQGGNGSYTSYFSVGYNITTNKTGFNIDTSSIVIGDYGRTETFKIGCSNMIELNAPQIYIQGGDCKATKFFCYHDDVGGYRDLGSFTGQSVYNGTSKCYLGGNLIQYGIANFANLSADTPSTQTISFSASFEYPPVVIACPNTTVPQKISVGTSSVTTSSFKLTCTRINSTETNVFWVAIGSRA